MSFPLFGRSSPHRSIRVLSPQLVRRVRTRVERLETFGDIVWAVAAAALMLDVLVPLLQRRKRDARGRYMLPDVDRRRLPTPRASPRRGSTSAPFNLLKNLKRVSRVIKEI
jgi:hypothetical protein